MSCLTGDNLLSSCPIRNHSSPSVISVIHLHKPFHWLMSNKYLRREPYDQTNTEGNCPTHFTLQNALSSGTTFVQRGQPLINEHQESK